MRVFTFMIGAPCQSSSLLTRTRTLSSRQIRQRGSLRSKSAHSGSAALVIVLEHLGTPVISSHLRQSSDSKYREVPQKYQD